ncbi:MAG: hypothetical protein JRJ38_07120 [Deltaproteobacteria bacterium]|nr:hypothetical protein [Deltaproteobacteria bacterium]
MSEGKWTKIGALATILGVIITVVALLLQNGSQQPQPYTDDCSSISPVITYPRGNDEVTNGIIVTGTVAKKPGRGSSLWLLVNDRNLIRYIYAEQIVIDSKNVWKKEVVFKGGMVGDKCNIEIILADDTAHSELNRFEQTKQVPSNIKRCTEVKVEIQQ